MLNLTVATCRMTPLQYSKTSAEALDARTIETTMDQKRAFLYFLKAAPRGMVSSTFLARIARVVSSSSPPSFSSTTVVVAISFSEAMLNEEKDGEAMFRLWTINSPSRQDPWLVLRAAFSVVLIIPWRGRTLLSTATDQTRNSALGNLYPLVTEAGCSSTPVRWKVGRWRKILIMWGPSGVIWNHDKSKVPDFQTTTPRKTKSRQRVNEDNYIVLD